MSTHMAMRTSTHMSAHGASRYSSPTGLGSSLRDVSTSSARTLGGLEDMCVDMRTGVCRACATPPLESSRRDGSNEYHLVHTDTPKKKRMASRRKPSLFLLLQGISFFLPNMTWLQPPGFVHKLIKDTWRPHGLEVVVDSADSAPAQNTMVRTRSPPHTPLPNSSNV